MLKRNPTFLFPVRPGHPGGLISYFLFLIFFSSCSVSKKISKSADKLVINDSSFRTAHVGISIFDPAENKYLFNYQGDKYFVPASNTKIPTCYAGMKYLGDSLAGLRYSFTDDLLIIQPTGDPTFLHPDYKISHVFEFLSGAGTKRITVANQVWLSDAWGNGWAWNDYDQGYMAERSSFPMYGNVVRFSFNGKGYTATPHVFKAEVEKTGDLPGSNSTTNKFRISRSLNSNTFVLQPSNQANNNFTVPFVADAVTWQSLLSDTLHKSISTGYKLRLDENSQVIQSQPTDSMLKPMMHRSDNFFAEQTLMMVSNEVLGEMNDSKIIDILLKTDFKDIPQRPRWADGSGLSRYNLFTPQGFIFILNKMKNEFGMERIKEIFPTGGEGTISSFYKTETGYIYAKTGTLSGVVAFSGFLYTKKNKLLIFSVLVNNHRASATDIRRAVERFLRGVRLTG